MLLPMRTHQHRALYPLMIFETKKLQPFTFTRTLIGNECCAKGREGARQREPARSGWAAFSSWGALGLTLKAIFSSSYYTRISLQLHSSCTTSLPDPYFFQKHPCPPTLCNQRLIQAKFRKSIPIRRKLHKKAEPNKVHRSNKQTKNFNAGERGSERDEIRESASAVPRNKEAGVNDYTKK